MSLELYKTILERNIATNLRTTYDEDLLKNLRTLENWEYLIVEVKSSSWKNLEIAEFLNLKILRSVKNRWFKKQRFLRASARRGNPWAWYRLGLIAQNNKLRASKYFEKAMELADNTLREDIGWTLKILGLRVGKPNSMRYEINKRSYVKQSNDDSSND